MEQTLTVALIAGGRGKRMDGQDKGLICLDGKPLVQRIAQQLRAHLSPFEVIAVANRNQPRYAAYVNRVISDDTPGYLGPMMGIYTALKNSQTNRIFVWPCDAPIVCESLIKGICRSVSDNREALIHVPVDNEEKLQPLFGVYHQGLLPALEEAIDAGHLALGRWVREQRHAVVSIEDDYCFTNLNRPQELDAFRALGD
ncbi:molybdenum cofactor guanylyltransferase [Sulfurivirga caldicuralii]|uniref:Molybdenum cofactor guanylyltransferase n=1 Tax=Sulfurivirga caldicuralii TaxID=364032 RepID=A0A1N6H6V9_9GAMM|nr:molybdenum cofactor guanylyltransferase [Sulfurivirga caldicuralii]SIO15425.1 molybdenum cofactor guanylyltransferase [Sulfurivirga caldicuralii]